MKAIVCPKSGPPEILQYKDVETPFPESRELLVKVRSATVTAGDVKLRQFPRIVLKVVGAVGG